MARLDFFLQQIAGHIISFRDAACLSAGFDKVIIQQTRADTIGVYAIDAYVLRAKLEGELAKQKERRCFW